MTCQQCGAEMVGRRRLYCDKSCSNRAYHLRRQLDPARRAVELARPGKRRAAVTKPCEVCGADYTTKRHRGRVCSNACRWWIDSTCPKSCAVPATHPSRATISPVIWSRCGWCERLTPGPRLASYCTRRHRAAAKAMRRRSAELNAVGTYTWADVTRLFLIFDRCCAYCAEPIDGRPEPDHVIPLSRGGSNSPSNLLPACSRCNSEKRDLTPSEWAAWRKSKGKPALPYSTEDPRWSHLAPTAAALAQAS